MILLSEIRGSKLVSIAKLQLNISINNQIIYKIAFLGGKCPEVSVVVWSQGCVLKVAKFWLDGFRRFIMAKNKHERAYFETPPPPPM